MRAKRRSVGGFTLLELMAALAIAALVMALAIPGSAKLYQNIQYRESVRDVVTLLSSARYQALKQGSALDVYVDPQRNEIRMAGKVHNLPEGSQLGVSTAAELSSQTVGVIRFYPEGGTSGGTVSISREDGSGVRVSVDWLVGRVTQEIVADVSG